MKTLLKTTFLALFVVFVAGLLASCELFHEHTFEQGWSFDESHHWHAATCGHDEVDGKSEHDWTLTSVVLPSHAVDGTTTYTCSVCGATKTVVTEKVEGHRCPGDWSIETRDGHDLSTRHVLSVKRSCISVINLQNISMLMNLVRFHSEMLLLFHQKS